MTIRKDTIVKCDECLAELAVKHTTSRDKAVITARSIGWTFKYREDLCPRCTMEMEKA